MKTITLLRGEQAKVDDQFHDAIVAMGVWLRHSKGYAAQRATSGMFLHHIICRLAGINLTDMVVDFENGNRLDCRVSNLVPCTMSEVFATKGPRNGNRFKGVFRNGNSWRAKITVDHTVVRLGSFDTAEKAAVAYDQAALKYFRRPYLNFPASSAPDLGEPIPENRETLRQQ